MYQCLTTECERRVRVIPRILAGSGWRLGHTVRRGAEGAATATRERATEVAPEVQTWTRITSLAHLHTYRFFGDSDIFL